MSHASDHRPAASLENLQRRSLLLAEVRAFFIRRDYWEAETPLLSHETCVDAWLDPFEVPLPDGSLAWLQTSPEFAMKRLLAAGAGKIFQVTRSFRRDECGLRHNPEFTILEWYTPEVDHLAQMSLVEELVLELFDFAVRRGWTSADRRPAVPIPRILCAEAFLRWAEIDLHGASQSELLEAARRAGCSISSDSVPDRDDLLNLLLAARVEPALAQQQAAFLYDYPATQAALARIRPGSPAVAERFELYLDGIEICNGYHELTDPVEFEERMKRENRKRIAARRKPLPESSRLLSAMQDGLPACAGVALGFDRLVMWVLGKKTLTDVLSFPFDRA